MSQTAKPTADGLLLVNKPVGITSFDVIRRLRTSTGVRKIGHAGTLDPLASGLMILLFGAACKQAERFSKLDKSYLADIRLGYSSTTGDNEGELRAVDARVPTGAEIEDMLRQFVGEIRQTPPVYSAIKIRGQEAYKRARAGEEVEIPSRLVCVYGLELRQYLYPVTQVTARVSSGTYIRTLAEDIGSKLGTGAYLDSLVRTSVGGYDLADAVGLDEVNASSLVSKLRQV